MSIDQSTTRGRMIAAALQLAAERPWQQVTLRDIAERAGGNLVDLRNEFASKGAVLAAFTRLIDDAVLAGAPKRLPTQTARDALFEVVMARLDALTPHRAAVKSILAAAAWEPAQARALFASQAWMLAAAGIGTGGPEGALKTAGLASIYGPVLHSWLDDDDPGLAKTMAVLDRRLRRGERTLETLDGFKRSICHLGSVFKSGGRSRAEKAAAPASAAPTAAAAPNDPIAPEPA